MAMRLSELENRIFKSPRVRFFRLVLSVATIVFCVFVITSLSFNTWAVRLITAEARVTIALMSIMFVASIIFLLYDWWHDKKDGAAHSTHEQYNK